MQYMCIQAVHWGQGKQPLQHRLVTGLDERVHKEVQRLA
jgi:hypothetical protein